MANQPTAVSEPKPKATVRIDIPKGSKGKMNLKGMEMGKEMSVMCKGKITRMSEDENYKCLEMELGSMEMMGKEHNSMGDDMDEVRKSKTMRY